MEVTYGSCRFGLWFVHVWYDRNLLHRVLFSRHSIEGAVPVEIRRYLRGMTADLSPLESVATEGDSAYAAIYRAVQGVPYGNTATYSDIAGQVGTSPRVVGQAMRRNPTPLIIPCHRIVAKHGIGGFTPSVDIKKDLLDLEQKNAEKLKSKEVPLQGSLTDDCVERGE